MIYNLFILRTLQFSIHLLAIYFNLRALEPPIFKSTLNQYYLGRHEEVL